jgi:hypothetical protein
MDQKRGPGRPTGRGKPVELTLPADTWASLDFLGKRKRLGNNANDVARYLIIRGIDDLTRSGQLPTGPIRSTDS